MAQVNSQAITAFQEYKLKHTGSYLIYQLNGKGEISLTKCETDRKEWEEFVNELPEDQACWAVKNFQYQTKEGGQRSKCVMIQWIPSNADKRSKMSYAMWSNTLKLSLQGIHCAMQANSQEDLQREAVLQRVARFERDEM